MSFNLVVAGALGYGALLFAVAFWADLRARSGRWLRAPVVYTLSLSIYCTAWTFYGAVGNAARSGVEFLTIYLGPTLVMIGWWGLLRRLVRIGRQQRITSIADLISSRFGKSVVLGGMVTVLAVVATTPYIALQLQSVTLSLSVFASGGEDAWQDGELAAIGLWVAIGLAVFAVLFGTRNLDANERHYGVVTAIALEAVVKLFALMMVGGFVVWGLAEGPADILAQIARSDLGQMPQSAGRWVALTLVSAMAFLTLPRMFHVLVVESTDDRHLALASWAFPAYLLGMSLFVLPIAVVGSEQMPPGANPDLFVLSVPLAHGQNGLAMLAFLGGFSSATSMVVVATIALATMVSNHVVMPLWLALSGARASISGDIRNVVVVARRAAIVGILGLGYLYYRVTGGGAALASIGIISFVGIVQIAPAMLAGLFWRGATRVGATLGVAVGFGLWAWCLLVPSLGPALGVASGLMAEGPWGIGLLRPTALFGAAKMDMATHAVMWSLAGNVLAVVLGSLLTRQSALERLQGVQFAATADLAAAASVPQPSATAEDLMVMSQRILGTREAQGFFAQEAAAQGLSGGMPEVTPAVLTGLERKLAGSVGAATAHAMIGQMTEGAGAVSVADLMAVADEAAQILEYSSQLEAKTREQARTAQALREANDKLTALAQQKDAFLSQISHELRTPMTSIRAFSNILSDGAISGDERRKFAQIIQDEAERLTRLLDDLLDLSVLENGKVTLNLQSGSLRDFLTRAQDAVGGAVGALRVERDPRCEEIDLVTDLDRLSQVFINLISNAAKYCDGSPPVLRIEASAEGHYVSFVDNGSGIPADSRKLIFEKFSRLANDKQAGGAGLGLAICKEIMQRLGGEITHVPRAHGTEFRVQLPRRH